MASRVTSSASGSPIFLVISRGVSNLLAHLRSNDFVYDERRSLSASVPRLEPGNEKKSRRKNPIFLKRSMTPSRVRFLNRMWRAKRTASVENRPRTIPFPLVTASYLTGIPQGLNSKRLLSNNYYSKLMRSSLVKLQSSRMALNSLGRMISPE